MSIMRYVVGFMFSNDLKRVALIQKNKPAWQRGKLNGIGGKIEPGESSLEAMVREFKEETGYATTPEQWEKFAELGGDNNNEGGSFQVDFYATVGDLTMLRTVEQEKIEMAWTKEIHPLRGDTVENLPWTIALAIDYLEDGRPCFACVSYKRPQSQKTLDA